MFEVTKKSNLGQGFILELDLVLLIIDLFTVSLMSLIVI